MQMLRMLVFLLVVTGGFTLSGLIGFGANVLSMPILSLFFPIQELVLILAIISFANAVYRVVENRKGIIGKEFLQMMAATLPGTLLGLWILKNLPEYWLKITLGCFVTGMASYNLYKQKNQKAEQFRQKLITKIKNRKNKIFYNIVLFVGGIMQGAFVCGGPLYLLYCSHYYGKDRLQFRGMQFAIILVNSSFIVFSYVWQGVYTKPLILQSGMGLLGLLAAILISNACLKQIGDTVLQQLVQIMLLISGVSLVLQSIVKIFSSG